MTSTDTREPLASEQGDDGSFRRKDARFRDFVTADGSSGYAAEAGRYHLYVSSACPWAHRTIIYRQLKDLEGVISMTVVDPERDERGWAITDAVGTTADRVNDFRFLSEAYVLSADDFDGHVTVPVLWDRTRGRIVNNESSEIIRMLDREFDAFAEHRAPLFPRRCAPTSTKLNAFVYENVNDGVYRTSFARTQGAYEQAFGRLQCPRRTRRTPRDTALPHGRGITEADWRLFPTLLRFDPVYVGHFKCNLRRVVDYPQLSGYLRELYQHPGIAATVDMDHIKRHYYRTHPSLNPSRIVPVGPLLDLDAPHGRDHLS
jgi:putative glutathione S-transferase